MKSKSNLPKSFGARVRNARKTRGYTQEELGFHTDLDRTYISGIERGVRNPSLLNIERIAKALKVRVRDLLD